MKAAAAQAGGQGHTSLRTAALRAFDFSSNPQTQLKILTWKTQANWIGAKVAEWFSSAHALSLSNNGVHWKWVSFQGCTTCSSTFAIMISPLKGWAKSVSGVTEATQRLVYHNLFSHFNLQQVGTIDVNDALYIGQSLLRNFPWCCRSVKHWHGNKR